MTRAKDISKIVTDADLSGTLDVTGAVTAGSVTISDDNNYSFGDGTTYIQGSGAADRLKFITNAAEAVRIDSSGNVGIGTSSPSGASGTTLAINGGSGQSRIALKNTSTGDSSGDGFQLSVGTDGSVGIEQRENNYMALYTNATERMRITSGGNVGIGTSPSAKLEVSGASNSTATFIKPQGALPDNNDNAGLYVLHQGTAGTGLRVRTDNALTGSNFAHILVNNASASINAFQVSQYGSGLIAKFDKSGTTAMQIDNSVAVTKPLQPAFLATATGQTNLAVNSTLQIGFASERFDQNADYNTTISTFTAPVTGKYQLQYGLRLDDLDSASTNYQLRLNTSNKLYVNIFDSNEFSSDLDYHFFTFSVIADMDASDTAIIQLFQNGGSQQTDVDTDSYFSGFLAC